MGMARSVRSARILHRSMNRITTMQGFPLLCFISMFQLVSTIEPEDHKSGDEATIFAVGLAEKGDVVGALPHFQAATKLSPRSADVWSDLGVTFMRISRSADEFHLVKAQDALWRARAIDPQNSAVISNLNELETVQRQAMLAYEQGYDYNSIEPETVQQQ